jgi:hypothetical protein
MPLTNPFDPQQTKAKEPIDEQLMDLNIRVNLENLQTQVDGITGGGSGGAAVDPREYFAEAEVFDDVGIITKNVFVLSQNYNANIFDDVYDHASDEYRARNITFSDGATITSINNTTYNFRGQYNQLPKDAFFTFKIKKGENYFSLIDFESVSFSDNVEVYIDGVLASNTVDENGNANSGAFTTFISPNSARRHRYFFGLDGEEHEIKVLNNDSASKVYGVSAFVVGYRTDSPSIDNTISINGGRATVKGVDVNYSQGSFSFTESTEGFANGHTGMLKVNTSGTVSAVDGLSPAQTVVKSNETVAFSGSVTELKVENAFAFPNKGTCIMSEPQGGEVYLFTYNGKDTSTIADHRLQNVKFYTQPSEDYTVYDGAFDTNRTNNSFDFFRGDLVINYWADPKILIDTSNNDLDFSITINGVTTTNAATVDQGYYGADYVQIQREIVNKLSAARPLPSGNYYCRYDKDRKRYSIGVDSPDVTAFELLFNTGVNSASEIGTTLGYSGDQTGALGYVSASDVNHASTRVFYTTKDDFDDPFNTRWAFGEAYEDYVTALGANLDWEKAGFNNGVYLNNGSAMHWHYYPSDDSCGATFYIGETSLAAYIHVRINDQRMIYPLQPVQATENTAYTVNAIKSVFLSWPKGTAKVTFSMPNDQRFKRLSSGGPNTVVLGAQPYFTKPKWEELADDEQILSTYEVAPLSLYATPYSGTPNGSTQYSPQPTMDNINTITEFGSWVSSPTGSVFNAGYRQTNTLNDYFEVDFTLDQSGGGIGFSLFESTSATWGVNVFLVNNDSGSASINEGTDFYCSFNRYPNSTTYYNIKQFFTGLTAGRYIARFKNSGAFSAATRLGYSSIYVIDATIPDEGAYTVRDLNNDGQGLPYAINHKKVKTRIDSAPTEVANRLVRGGMLEDKVTNIYTATNGSWIETDYTESTTLFSATDVYHGAYNAYNGVHTLGYFNFCKSMFFPMWTIASGTGNHDAFVNGTATPNIFSTTTENVKNGSAGGSVVNIAVNTFGSIKNLPCSFSAGSTYLITDTRGLKDGAKVRLFDGTNWENFTIENIVTDVSFDIKQTPATVVPANVERVDFSGYHSMNYDRTTAGASAPNFIGYEPLTLSPSMVKQRVTLQGYEESVSVYFRDIAADAFYYPVHSDGSQGNSKTSTIEIPYLATTTHSLRDLRAISGTLDLKVTSKKKIKIIKDELK